jgi:hypothetical protein
MSTPGGGQWGQAFVYRSLRDGVERDQLTVLVGTVGLRKEGDRTDIYRLAQKQVR